MTGKEALDDYKDFGKIKGESITSNHTFVPSDYHYEWKKEKNLEEQLTKYKRAFEILKEYNNVKFDLIDKKIIYYLDQENQAHVISKEEYELLEELMKSEETQN